MPTLPTAARDWILSAEGGFGDDPDDSGGPTRFGISQKAYPELDVRTLTLDRALELYFADYWTPIRGDELPATLAVALFDGAVNQGVHGAIARFQLGLNKLGLGPLTVDGLMGPKTIHEAHKAVQGGLVAALPDLLSFRAVSYAQLASDKPSQKRFLRGWMKRLFALEAYCLLLGAS